MDELLEQFLIEGRDLAAQASRDFSLLAVDPRDAAVIESAFRAIHTLKGSVGLFDMAPAHQVLHAAEDVLERARKGTSALDGNQMVALTSCLDQVDRWIDQLEDTGHLSGDAAYIAASLIGTLEPEEAAISPAGPAVAQDADLKSWVAILKAREVETISSAQGSLTAFRYAPDVDCFFRGDDPLAVVAAVPEILSLTVLPADGGWPAANEMEPFACLSIFEGLSSSSLDEVKAAFRLVADQTAFATINPAAQEAVDPAMANARAGGILRIQAVRLEAISDGLGELIVAINTIAPLAEHAERSDPRLATKIRRAQVNLERVTGQIYRTVISARSVALEPALRRLPRMAREIADGLGKQVHFVISTNGIEVDKQIADVLFEPLLHLIRNAIDHGIEPASERRAAGKPSMGEISLTASRDGDAVAIVLRDDGAGIDPARIRKVAIVRNVRDTDEIIALSDSAAMRLIFLPGFSTANEVTSISGRGIGMDAVQHVVNQLGGSIDVMSGIGTGTTFRMRLPVSSLTTRLLVVNAGDNRYGVSLDQIIETVRVDQAALMAVGHGVACVLRGRTIPVLSLSRLLGGEERDERSAKLIVTQLAGESVALRVDGFEERIDTVVRPPSGVLASVPGVIGSALLGDGDVLLVLDLPELVS